MLVLDHIRRAITRYSMLVPGQRVAVAVSGGADSVALLAALRELAPAWGVTLAVAHVNHELRGAESETDQRFVEELAAAAGLVCHVHRGPVTVGDNLEQSAREQRRTFFAELVRTGIVDRVATAHTEDDQAETVLLRLLRGAGPTGLAAILPVTREGLIRPALEVSRATLRDWAGRQGIRWREDQSNLDPAFTRNRLRSDLMPTLERDWNPGLKPLLAQTAELAQEDNACLDAMAAERAAELFQAGPYESWLLPVPGVLAQPAALQGRLVRLAVERIRGNRRRLDYEHVKRILMLAESGDGDGRLQVPGVDVLRSFQWLRFAHWPSRAPADRNWHMGLAFDSEIALPGDPCRLLLKLLPGTPETWAYNGETDWLDVSAISVEELELRNWRPGDVFRRPGRTPEKVKLLFQQGRIPLWDRRNWPMVTRKDEIVWSLGLGVAEGFEAGPGSAKCLALKVMAPSSSAVNMQICLNQNGSVGRL